MGNIRSLSVFLATATAAGFGAATGAQAFKRIDYLVIGGGPAGLVLTEQLSRHPGKNVVLLEAGPDSINDPLVNSESIQSPSRHLTCIKSLTSMFLSPFISTRILPAYSCAKLELYHGAGLQLGWSRPRYRTRQTARRRLWRQWNGVLSGRFLCF